MLLRFADLKGMEVLANKEGKLLGTVRRLQLDSKKKIVTGLVFKGKGLASEHWTKVKGIQRIGQDVVFLSDMSVVQKTQPTGRDVKGMLGLPVTSLDGKRLGSLADVVVESTRWSIVALTLDNGGEVEVMPEAVFGEDTVLLQKGAHEKIHSKKGSSASFLSRVFNSAEEEVKVSQAKKRKSTPGKRTKKTIPKRGT